MEIMRLKSTLCGAAALLAGTLALTGCASVETIDDIATTGSITRRAEAGNTLQPAEAGRPSLSVDVPVTQALVTVPDSLGAVIAVSEQRTIQHGKTESVTQRITLKGDARTLGENTIDVTLRQTQPGDAVTPITDADLATYRDQAFAGLTPVAARGIITTGLGPMAITEAAGPTQRCAIAVGHNQSAAGATGFQGGMQMEVKARFCSGSRPFAAIEAGLAGLTPRGDMTTTFAGGFHGTPNGTGDALTAAGAPAPAAPIQREIPRPSEPRAKVPKQVAGKIDRIGNPKLPASIAVPLPDAGQGTPHQMRMEKPIVSQITSTTPVPMP